METPVANDIACQERDFHQRGNRGSYQDVVRQPESGSQHHEDANRLVAWPKTRVDREQSSGQPQETDRTLPGERERFGWLRRNADARRRA